MLIVIVIALCNFKTFRSPSDIWLKTGNSLTIAEWLTDKGSISMHAESDRHFFWFTAALGSALDILNHPTDIDKPQKSIILYQNHVPTSNGTAGYADIDTEVVGETHTLPCSSWYMVSFGYRRSAKL